jgi:23S rRNA (cytosine1962-C5)-methyltransferase
MAENGIILKKNCGSVRFGHPWVYKSQIREISGAPLAGDLASIFVDNKKIGTGYFNPNSQIAVRLLTREAVEINKDFFKGKLLKAIAERKRFVKDTNAFRLLFSEADGLPGLIIDQYDETLVIQILTLGMERLRAPLLQALEEVLPAFGIYERSDSASRVTEGLEKKSGWIKKIGGDEVSVFEKDVKYVIRLGEGHKTGFYLDQRENRFLFRDLGVKGAVLDAFCYEGSFGMHLAKSGAKVLGIDINEAVIKRAKENRKLNHISDGSLDFRVADVFEELKKLENEKKKYDFVILDPPSFVKRKAELEGAISGYKEIILRGLRLLNDEGYLAIFSCSYHVNEELLMQIAMNAALDTHKSLRVIKFLKQSADHPINPFVPETYYLKGFLFWVTSL